MSAGAEYLDERNAQAMRDRLDKAAAFVRIHAKNPLFQKRMGRYLVRVEWPGVLIVADPETGTVYAQSQPGNPTQPAQAPTNGGKP